MYVCVCVTSVIQIPQVFHSLKVIMRKRQSNCAPLCCFKALITNTTIISAKNR